MRRAAWACISVFMALGGLSSYGWAVERELCGVRLGDQALSLLDRSGYGQPAYIGPLGTVSVAAPQQGQAVAGRAGARRAGASTRSGPSGPARAGARGGGRGGGGGAGRARDRRMAAPGLGSMTARRDLDIVLTGGGRDRSDREARGGGRRAGAGGGGGGRRGGGRAAVGRGGRAGAAAGRGRVAVGRGAVQGSGMYWYYRRPGGAVIVLTLNLKGEVTAITLAGLAPTPGGRTTKGIGLGNGYMDLIAQYGYPDQSISAGTMLEMVYVDHGVRFTLDSMRVRQIEIGAPITAEAQTAPAAPTEAPPPAGMSTEELRGYL